MQAWRERGFVLDSDDEDDLDCGSYDRPSSPQVVIPVSRSRTPIDYDSDGTREQRRVVPSSQPSEDGFSYTLLDDVDRQNIDRDPDRVAQKLPHSPLRGQDAVLSPNWSSQTSLSDTFVEADPGCGDQSKPLKDGSVSQRASASTACPVLSPRRPFHIQSASQAYPINGNSSNQISPRSFLDDIPSSDLSEVIDISDDDNLQAARQDTGTREQISQFKKLLQNAPAIKNRPEEKRPSGRALRTRKPEQLHPYLIELERYRATLKARGVKPVRAVETQLKNAYRDQSNEAEETQDREFRAADSPLSGCGTPAASSSPPQLGNGFSTAATHVESPVASFNFDLNSDDDLPDIADILHPAKRRKTAATISRKGQRATEQTTLHIDTLAVDRHSPQGPLSPPSTKSSSQDPLLADQQEFRMPLGFTPVSIAAPKGSSSTRRRTRRVVQDSSDIESPSGPAPATVRPDPIEIDDAGPSSSSSSDSDTTKSSQVRVVQKRIKGVLPASWLRLDRQAQLGRGNVGSRATQRNRPPSRSSPHKGVAQRVTKPSRRTRSPTPAALGQSAMPVVLSDSDSDHVRNGQTPVISPAVSEEVIHDEDPTSTIPDPGDVFENDWIDPMLPSLPRSATSKQRGKKRQIKLTDSFRQPKKPRTHPDGFSTQVKSANGPVRSPKKRSSHRKRASKALGHSVPSFGVLDSLPRGPIPPFLKIAARSARQRFDKARHSPTNKYFRLQTREDTEDANQLLRDWRAGTVIPSIEEPSPPSHTPERAPLSDQSNLQQQRLPGATLKAAARLRESQRQLNGAAGKQPKLRQGSLKPVLLKRQQPEPHTRDPSKSDHAPVARSHSGQQRSRNPAYRNAQLEALQDDFEVDHRPSAFRRRIDHEEQRYADRNINTSRQGNPQLDRFLEDEDDVNLLPQPRGIPEDLPIPPQQATETESRSPRRMRRKRPAKRIDAQAVEYRQPSEPIPLDEPVATNVEPERPLQDVLLGLGPYGTRYSTTFDVFPLEVGTFFHESTLLGSKVFHDSLTLKSRTLDDPMGFANLDYGQDTNSWSSWTEEVISDISRIFGSTRTELERFEKEPTKANDPDVACSMTSSTAALKSVIRYFSDSLTFLDPIDRRSFVARMLDLIESLFEAAVGAAKATFTKTTSMNPIVQRIWTSLSYVVIVSNQVRFVSGHSVVQDSVREDAESRLIDCTRTVVDLVFDYGLPQVRSFMDENRRHAKREAGVRDDMVAVECVVLTYHVLDRANLSGRGFWDLVCGHLLPGIDKINNAHALERIWYDTFTVLPLLELDSTGHLRIGQRFQRSVENWSVIRAILLRLFRLYESTSARPGSMINSYLRSVFIRCHHLIQGWGWRRCESILLTMFDFFTKRGLQHLRNESPKGSPAFLGRLHEELVLTIEPDDQSFDLFLKVLATGLREMREVYPDKMFVNVVWRLLPLHNRTYRRDESMKVDDLDALRNHHDVFCTLYWASPPSCRPKLDTIKNLVDHTASHRAACRLGVCAWTNLVRFQLSTTEPCTSLEPFARWSKEIIEQTVSQYWSAKTEAEAEFARSKGSGAEYCTPDLLKKTIISNQSAVLATLIELVAGARSALELVRPELAATATLFEQCGIVDLFRLFDARKSHVVSLIKDVLNIIILFSSRFLQATSTSQPPTSEDSQEFGSWDGFDELLENSPSKSVAVDQATLTQQNTSISFPHFIHDPLSRLLSNAFGADHPPDDQFLTTLVKAWVSVAGCLVRSDLKEWTEYLEGYSSSSWQSLRDMEKTRQWWPLMMAQTIRADPTAYEKLPHRFMTVFFGNMVERDADLRFQPDYLLEIMHRDPDHVLLQGLPIIEDPSTGRMCLTLTEFRFQRNSIIGKMLENMRSQYDRTAPMSVQREALRAEYKDYIQSFTEAMKRNWKEVCTSGGSYQNGAGSYVSFVHGMVELLHQHAAEICTIDQFFTNHLEFAVPAHDPTYMVGQLKAYTFRLADSGLAKRLVTFILTAAERAAVDNQQLRLLDHLANAMEPDHEDGDFLRPTLRCFYMHALLPVALELCFRNTAGWIVTRPIIQVAEPLFDDLICRVDTLDPDSIQSVAAMIVVVLSAFQRCVGPLVSVPRYLFESHKLHMLEHILTAFTKLLPVANYVSRCSDDDAADDIIAGVMWFAGFICYLRDFLIRSEDEGDGSTPFGPTPPETRPTPSAADAVFADVRAFAHREIRQLETRWTRVGHAWVLTRNNQSRPVDTGVKIRSLETVRMAFAVLSAIDDLNEFPDLLGFPNLAESSEELPLLGQLVL